MTRLRVHRSPLRQFLMGLAGLLLLIAAIEIVWAHQITLDPETDDNGELTARGEARRRQDYLVGLTFVLTGGGLVGVALAGLLNPRPVAEIDDDGIRLRISGPQASMEIGWQEIHEVRSAREPGDGRRARPVLLVRLRDPESWPDEYWGARRQGPWLVVDADTWSMPPDEVSVHARLAHESWQRAATAAAPGDTEA